MIRRRISPGGSSSSGLIPDRPETGGARAFMIKRWTIVSGWVVLGFGFGSFLGLSVTAAALWALGVLVL